jgi:hypothetical protein
MSVQQMPQYVMATVTQPGGGLGGDGHSSTRMSCLPWKTAASTPQQ